MLFVMRLLYGSPPVRLIQGAADRICHHIRVQDRSSAQVPRGASAGRFGVVAVVSAGSLQKTLSRSVQVGR